MYHKIIIDNVEIETQVLDRGWKTPKGRLKKYIGIFVFLLIGIAVSSWAASQQASGSIEVYQHYLNNN